MASSCRARIWSARVIRSAISDVPLPLGRLSLWLTLDAVTGIGPVTAARLLAHFDGDIDALFGCDDGVLRSLGLQSAQLRQLRWPSPVVEQGLNWAEAPGNHLLCLDDPAYPALLKEIPAAPLLLYCRGDLAALSLPQLAMVGTVIPPMQARTTPPVCAPNWWKTAWRSPQDWRWVSMESVTSRRWHRTV